jgi:hypothetical protein
MNTHPHDLLTQSPGVSALVRRILVRLSGELAFNGHATISPAEGAGFFNLGDASAQLDRIACLPGMAEHETRARRDLLEIYDIFNPLDLESTQEMPLNLHGKSPIQTASETLDVHGSWPLSVVQS